MAATTVLTASNGWKFRPMEETSADQDFFIKCWKDFPQGANSYMARLERFSWHLDQNDVFDETNLNTFNASGTSHIAEDLRIATYISERNGTKIGINTLTFGHEVGKMTVRFEMIDPDERGNGYHTDQSILRLGLMEHWNMTHLNVWHLDPNEDGASPAVAALRTKWTNLGFNMSGTSTTIPNAFHQKTQNVQHAEGTIAQYRDFKAGDSDWTNVTWSYS